MTFRSKAISNTSVEFMTPAGKLATWIASSVAALVISASAVLRKIKIFDVGTLANKSACRLRIFDCWILAAGGHWRPLARRCGRHR